MPDQNEDAARVIWLIRFWGALVIASVFTAAAFVLADLEVAAAVVPAVVWIIYAGAVLVSGARHPGGSNAAVGDRS